MNKLKTTRAAAPAAARATAAVAVLAATLGTATPASAACSHTTSIRNNSSITLRFAELKSSYAQPFFKRQ